MINKLKEKLAKEETKPGSSEHFAFGGLSGPASLDLVADVIAVLEAQAGEIARFERTHRRNHQVAQGEIKSKSVDGATLKFHTP